MQSDDIQTLLIILADLGSVENYDPTLQPKATTAKDPLRAGGLYLQATLHEMVKIIRLCKSLEENHCDLLRDTKAQYDKWVYWRSLFRIVTPVPSA